MIPCAYLRVYRPLDSFPEDERSKWERYILSGVRPGRGRTIYRDEPLDGGLFGFLMRGCRFGDYNGAVLNNSASSFTLEAEYISPRPRVVFGNWGTAFAVAKF